MRRRMSDVDVRFVQHWLEWPLDAGLLCLASGDVAVGAMEDWHASVARGLGSSVIDACLRSH